MTKNEINKYLDQKVNESDEEIRCQNKVSFLLYQGFRFELGEQERWKSLVAYIREKPVEDIL